MAAGGPDPPVLAAAAGMSHIQIPPGLTELLQGYTVEVLRQQPPDLVDFAVDYFTRLREARSQPASPPAAPPSGSQGLEPGAGLVADAKADTESEDDEDLDGRRRVGPAFVVGGRRGRCGGLQRRSRGAAGADHTGPGPWSARAEFVRLPRAAGVSPACATSQRSWAVLRARERTERVVRFSLGENVRLRPAWWRGAHGGLASAGGPFAGMVPKN